MLGLLFLLNIAGVANASIVEWRLRDVSFEDASTAAGFLLFDTAIAPSPGDSIAAPISYDIKRTAGFFPAFEYTPEVSRAVVGDDPNPFVLLFLNTPPTEPSQRGSLRFGLQMPLPSAGGVVPLTLASGINHNCVSTCAPKSGRFSMNHCMRCLNRGSWSTNSESSVSTAKRGMSPTIERTFIG